jgi:cell division protein FtsI (penicillin-binding protein 3)
LDLLNTNRKVPRVTATVAILVSIALLLTIRFGFIMVPGTGATESTASPVVERGPILDQRGRILAIQTRLDTVTAWKPAIVDVPGTARILADILDRDPRDIADALAASEGFLTIQRTITPSQTQRISARQRSGELQGIRLQPDLGRVYPERDTAAAVIGYAGVDNVGLSGVEYMFTEYLTPTTDPRTSDPLLMGNQVFLTLDLAIQSIADDLGRQLLGVHQADAVMILVADARTGGILAMSGQPSFDLNNFRSYSPDSRRNNLISRIYEPGSVFKIFSIGAFLELGGITPDDRFQTSGGYVADRDGFIITDLADYGVVTPEQIIKFSSNVGAAYASETVDPGAFYTILRAFGFGSITGIDLNGEERGLLASPENWSRRTQQTLAIGQEIGVTALQMVSAATVFANDGILLRPQIVDRIVAPGGEVIQRFGREPLRQVISPYTARTMLQLMRSSTDPDGTAWRISVEGVSVAAKTGTAEVYDGRIRGYSDTHFIASALALFPAEDPELIVYVMIDHPRGESFYGGRIAAPATKELIDFLVPYWNIPRDTDTVVEHSGRIAVRRSALPVLEETVPDLIGLPLRSLIPLLARDDLHLRIEGSGYVARQDPPAGTAYREGMTIRLELE